MQVYVNIRMTSRDWMCDQCVVTDAWMSYSQWYTSLSVGVTMRTQGTGGLLHGVLIIGHRVDGILLVIERRKQNVCIFHFIP